MQISVPKEVFRGEGRVSILPSIAKKLIDLGVRLCVESGIGDSLGIKDDEYEKVGANIVSDRKQLISAADLIIRLNPPELDEVALLKQGSVHVSYLDPFNNRELIKLLADRKISAIAMEMIPRITRAQKMDSLSSQASLAGYVSVIIAAERIKKVFPMMMTPAGTINPARVFIVGAGVAGLQAIATAKRLGARVDAFDVRPVAAEQVESLGAKFVKIDLGETGEASGGYAKQLTAEQIEKQKELMAKYCSMADIVITTAQVFGKKAPVIISTAMIKGMKSGSVVVDMAVDGGGNVECSQAGQEVNIDGVLVIGIQNLPASVGLDASLMYSNNLFHLIDEFINEGSFVLNLEDEIIKGCLVTHNGKIVSKMLNN